MREHPPAAVPGGAVQRRGAGELQAEAMAVLRAAGQPLSPGAARGGGRRGRCGWLSAFRW